ncbi:tRNA (adenosine(37)-N6)-dimethylallyltransferase MiaA [Lacticaseibacillus daqingensis]|uniref:tRNA (adenosine(37)-N6)-dimethylallyltransferase MiaA n=1 Tax=Lacticaseibacillus daqingensis TaxID=2486014 RepID=UPI000F79C106|nr:tRNA (adenosine(37)-N6)-dimethylallyltransferase MiaA [Lacticaseibacillus daqingensis]
MNKSEPKTKILMIGGPTATGKSALAVSLAQAFNGEVINGDAYQVYRGMDIGTAKVTAAEMAGVPHHLIDIVAPSDPFSVVQFKRRAQAAITAITARGKLPIVVGGTGFYLNALRLDLPLGGAAPPTPLRTELQTAAPADLWARLNAVDPVAAAKIPVGNTRRVIRALEVIQTTGVRVSEQPPPTPAYNALVLGLTTERAALYARIDARVNQMIAAGLVAEVQTLLKTVPPSAQALQAIGYKELVPYVQGTVPLAAAVAAIQQHSRRYAKRQLTYFRHQMPTHWFDLLAHPEIQPEITALVDAWSKNSMEDKNELER